MYTEGVKNLVPDDWTPINPAVSARTPQKQPSKTTPNTRKVLHVNIDVTFALK